MKEKIIQKIEDLGKNFFWEQISLLGKINFINLCEHFPLLLEANGGADNLLLKVISKKNSADLVRILLDKFLMEKVFGLKRANALAKNEDGIPILFIAIMGGVEKEIIQLLLDSILFNENIAKDDYKDDYDKNFNALERLSIKGLTVFGSAVLVGNVEIVQLLLSYGFDPKGYAYLSEENEKPNITLLESARILKIQEIIKILIDSEANIKGKDSLEFNKTKKVADRIANEFYFPDAKAMHEAFIEAFANPPENHGESPKSGERKTTDQQVFINPAMGMVNPDGSVYEPNIDVYFTRKITDDEMSIYSNMIQLQKDSEQDRSTVYSIYPERTSMNVYNVTTLQSHDKFISKVKELVEIFNDKEPYDHLYSHIEISIRHLWNFGDPRGGATRTYEQVIGNSSNLQNPKVIRSSGDYSTLEEFEVALKKALGNLGHTVGRSTKPENPNKSSKTFEVKFFN